MPSLATQQAWLNSDGAEESDSDEQPPLAVREENLDGQNDKEDHEDTPQTMRRSSVSPPQRHRVSSDARPWLLKLSPQWVDFKRRRSSLLSLHFGKGSRISRTMSTQESKLGLLGSAARLRPRTASTDSRTLLAHLSTTYSAAGGVDRNPSCAKNLPFCTEIDHKVAASETSADHDDVAGDNSRTSSFSGIPKNSRCLTQQQQRLMPHHSDERHGEMGVTAGLGRHRRPSGTWALDNSTHDGSFSGFSSEIDGSKSSIEVHNFLEESVGSPCEDGGSRDGAESIRGDGLSHRGGVGDGRNNDSGGNDLDAQDIRFLSDGKKLRDVLLAVDDLHFSEQKYVHVGLRIIHGLLCLSVGWEVL